MMLPWLRCLKQTFLLCVRAREGKLQRSLTSSVPYSVKVWLELAEQPTQFRI